MGNGIVKPESILFHFRDKDFIAKRAERIFLQVKENGEHNQSNAAYDKYNQRLSSKEFIHVVPPNLFFKCMRKKGASFFRRMSFFILFKYVIIDKRGSLGFSVSGNRRLLRGLQKLEEKHYEYFSPFDFSG